MNLKKQAFNPYLPSWEYIPDGDPMFLGTGFMYLVPMINITDMFFVWEIMCVGQHP